jgi:protein-L-isoaspartate(D-aspartate) O-methyltransferase
VHKFLPLLLLAILFGSCSLFHETEPFTGSLTEIPVDTTSLIQPTATETIPATKALTASGLDFEVARGRMVESGIVGWGITDEAVIEAMGQVPRHEFVSPEYMDQAYANAALPIGYGQTISQPYIVALMTQELNLSEGDRVLEIGTGSGYQAAVLSQLGIEVYTMEIIGPLFVSAKERLDRLGYTGIEARHADGYYGWEEKSPFDGIIVTAAPDHVPQPLLAQLKIGGVMVIPVGPIGAVQELWRITRVEEDSYQSASLGGGKPIGRKYSPLDPTCCLIRWNRFSKQSNHMTIHSYKLCPVFVRVNEIPFCGFPRNDVEI